MNFRDIVAGLASPRALPFSTGAVILSFLFAVTLLGAATEAAEPMLTDLLEAVVVDDASALGLAWVSTYVLTNGSVIAALAISLFTIDVLTPAQLFVMVAGSRLGSAAIVVFIGALDYVQRRRFSLQRSVSMGLLTFLLTLSIYLPVTIGGYLALPSLRGPLAAVSAGWAGGIQFLTVFDPATTAITAAIGPGPAFVGAVLLLFGSLNLFDRLLEHVDTATIRRRFLSRLGNTWMSFLVGFVLTGATTSVAFSIGVIVPLYNRGYVEREELIPYVLGANLGTLFDTLVVAATLQSPVAVTVVLALFVASTLLTLLVLVFADAYVRGIVAIDTRVAEDRRAFVGFILLLVAVPVVLVAVPVALA